ncbi:MAG TPA: PAS domain S-box protein [Methanosarcina sp.]|nr:PAS domain S-box protein [Methanosarcina sp.]
MRNSVIELTEDIEIIKNLSWGTHFCQFFSTKKDLMDIAIPYFKIGLEQNELCQWGISQPLEIEEAKEALRKAIPGFNVYLKKGQIEIISYTHGRDSGEIFWKNGFFDAEETLKNRIEKANKAFQNGYSGLRLIEDALWLKEGVLSDFIDYQKKLDEVICNYKMKALSAYSLDKCSAAEIIEISANHQFALIKKEGKWERIENSGRRKAKEAAFQAEKEWESTFNAVTDPIAVFDNNYRFIRANKAIAEKMGMTPEECVGLTCYRVVHGMDEPPSFCPQRRLLDDGLPHTLEVREDSLGGNFTISVSPMHNSEGKLTGCVHIVRDINEPRKVDEVLLRRENEFRTLAENSPDLIARFDRQGHILYINPAFAELYRLSSEEIIGKTNSELGMDPGKVKYWEKYHKNVYTLGKSETVEFLYTSPQGKNHYFNTRLVPEFINDEVTSVLAVSRDITDIKESEAKLKETCDNSEELVKERTAELEQAYVALKENEEFFAEAQRMAHIGHWKWDILTDEAYWSDELYRIFGRDPQELAPTHEEYLSYVHPDDLEYVTDACNKAMEGKPCNIDHRIILANGEERTVHKQFEVILNEENIPVQIKGIIQDITRRKKIEQELELSEEKYRSFIQNFTGIAFQLDENMNLELMKGNVEEITGYSEEELVSRKLWKKIIETEDLPLFLFEEQEMKNSQFAFNGELDYRIRSRDGKIKWVHEIYQKIPGKDGKPDQYQGVIYDITERKKAEESLATMEIARKKEIHHRIKNNLQVVSSLLDLQAEKLSSIEFFKGSEVLETFRESQNRIISISMIHEKLHEEGIDNALNFSPYLERLVKNLFETYRLGDTDVELDMNLEENIFFDMDTAVPLGLIVNEIVSNSLKYAFLDTERGTIKIKLCREDYERSREYVKKEVQDGTNFILMVSDNGTGIPETINLENPDTLGVQLVTILVEQLGGELELKREPGTEFIIRFTVPGEQ